MYNPFTEATSTAISDEALVLQAKNGEWHALEQLIGRHQAWIFNIAVRMVHQREEAEDITQEVLLKMLTKLSTFQGKSSFRTWLYRIVVNDVLNLKQRPQAITFSEFGKFIEELPDQALPDQAEVSLPLAVLVEEAKVGCTVGMLLCLDQRQRLVFILGEIFGVTSEMGAELMDLSPSNFRQLLSRARHDLYNYMNDRCGLINQSNPCRCARKTRAFIEQGYVDPRRRQFTREHFGRIAAIAPDRTQELDQLVERQHAAIYRDHPFLAAPDLVSKFRQLLNLPAFRTSLMLDAQP
ncbi:MAG TPA: RNA polymerase sigma factor [Ktedonobacterales bacterium]|nr:RNA polymerase sigma factor [Ktedonobacterales bacterium]